MDINHIIKKSTELKKTSGYNTAINYLISSYHKYKPNEIVNLVDKISSYYKHDLENNNVKDFFDYLTNNIVDKYSLMFCSYYLIIKDYNSYYQTVSHEISKVNPNDPWKYCYQLKEYKLLICNYYNYVKIDDEKKAADYIYNLITSNYFLVAQDLIANDYNFTLYFNYKNHNIDYEFQPYDRLFNVYNSIDNWFKNEKDLGFIALKQIQNIISNEKIIKLIKDKIFFELPKQLGFKDNLLNTKNINKEEFALTFFDKNDYNNIDLLNEKIKFWKVNIASKTTIISNKGANEIIDYLFDK